MIKSLYEAGLKVKRANEHILELHRRLRDISAVDQDSYEVHVEYDSEAGSQRLKVESTHNIPSEFLVVVGDVVHNLRASLDYIMGEFEFPIRKTRQELIGAMNGGLKDKGCPDLLIGLILDEIQPYEGGRGDALYALHRLDIEDKHRLLIAKRQLTFVSGIRLKSEDGIEIAIPDWLIVESRIASHPIRGNGAFKVIDKGKATASIVFGEGMPLEGQEIRPALRSLSIVVNQTVGLIGGMRARYAPICP
ncbi:MAG: hypothetical protein WB439_09270 [Acidobacteriaceae bacterium]